MKKLLAITALALALTGCASTEYAQYTSTQQAIAAAQSATETARYQELGKLATNGNDSTKALAIMALALGTQKAGQATSQVAAPQRSDALMWASLLVPTITQAYSISKSAEIAINSSNNSMLTSTATTAGFVGIASQIQAPQASIYTTTTSNTSDQSMSMSGTGVLGSGSYSTQANPVSTPVFAPVVVPDVIVNQPVVVPDVIVTQPVIVPDVIVTNPIE